MTDSRPRVDRSRPTCTLEERLHHVHDQFVLLADLFELHAAAPEHLQGGALSAPASRALTESCRHAARDVRALLDALPAALTNWSPSTERPAKPTE